MKANNQNQGIQEELQPPALVVPFNTDEKHLEKISIQDVLLAMNQPKEHLYCWLTPINVLCHSHILNSCSKGTGKALIKYTQ